MKIVVDLTLDSAKHWICHICFGITKVLLYGLLKYGGLKYIYTISKKLYFYLYIFPHKFFYKVKVKHARQTALPGCYLKGVVQECHYFCRLTVVHCRPNVRTADRWQQFLHEYNNLFQSITQQYTGCPRRNVPDFGRVFLMLNYTDITQNT